MKRRDLSRHLESSGRRLRREGSRHTIYTNPSNGKSAPVPRHNEISSVTARAICNQLGIPHPSSGANSEGMGRYLQTSTGSCASTTGRGPVLYAIREGLIKTEDIEEG